MLGKMMRSSLEIEVRPLAGSNVVEEVIPELIALAKILRINVRANCNGVTIIVDRSDCPDYIGRAWLYVLGQKTPHKYVSGATRIPGAPGSSDA